MSAEKQYIELYESQRQLIDANSAPALNAHRAEAARILAQVGLRKPNDASQTDPEAILSADYALNLARHEVPTSRDDLFTCAVPELSTNIHFLVNEQYVNNAELSRNNKPAASIDGVYAGSLRQFATEHPELIVRYYNQLASKATDTGNERSRRYEACSLGESALNTMLCQDGFVLYVQKDVKVEKPLQLISLMRAVDDLMAVQRLLIIVEDDASANLLMCEHDSNISLEPNKPAQLLSLQTTELYLGVGAQFNMYSLQEHHSNVSRLGQIYVSQAEASNCTIGLYTLTAGKTRNRVQVILSAPGANINLYGMATLDAEQHVDNLTFVDHRSADCQSNELFKYTLADAARGSFLGRILVREGAIQTDAHQTNRNLCLSADARMVARPELEIYADDVKCSHGATVGQLDQNALFYLRSRGIAESEARMLLMFAFMADVIDAISLEPLRDRLRHLIEKRYRGELTQCRGCNLVG